MKVYYESKDGYLCFNHAVEAAMKGTHIEANVDEPVTTDCYDSFAGIIPMCKICNEETEIMQAKELEEELEEDNY